MLITRKWLDKYLDLAGINNTEIIKAFNSLGFEVDRTYDYDQNSNVYCGRVQIVNPIKDSNLKFCLVDSGNDLVEPIVCGALNPLEDGSVLVARLGAILANGMEIQAREIKGFPSEGMMCSLSELGIDEKYLTEQEKNEIVQIFDEIEIPYEMIGSVNILEHIGLTDFLFEVDLTLNRSDCLSAYELAREIGNYFNRPLFSLEVEYSDNMEEYENIVKVTVDTKSVDVAISANVIVNAERKPLKLADRIWLKINQYKSDVDDPFGDLAIQTVIETGQPVLVYDRSKIKTELKISDNYENKEFQIKKGDLVVIDGHNFVELIGIRINPAYLPNKETREITIVALHLDHLAMREQQRKVGISNINLQRYIKPLSYSVTSLGMGRFLYLLRKNNILSELSAVSFIKEHQKDVKPIVVTLKEINALIGHSFKKTEIENLLVSLGFEILVENNVFRITPPITRTDIWQKADLIEEIARLYGYDNILETPPVLPNIAKELRKNEKTIKSLESLLGNNGFHQGKTYALVNQKEIQEFNFFQYQNPYQLLLPLSTEHEIMRLSLLNGLLRACQYNNARNNKSIKMFTIEKIYANNVSFDHACFVAQEEIISSKITKEYLANSYYYMKSLLETFLQNEQINVEDLDYQTASLNKIYHPYQTAIVYLNKQQLGIIGVISPRYQKEMNLKLTYFCEINLDIVYNYPNKKITFFEDLTKYSASTRDVSIVIPENQSYGAIENKIKTGVNYLTEMVVIDEYFDKKELNQQKAITISFTFNRMDQQLTEHDINQEFEKIKQNIVSLKFKIR